MRTYSVHQIKMRLRGKKCQALQAKPREGTKVREVYDLFIKSPGQLIKWKVTDRTDTQVISQLRLAYGLDIRSVRHTNSNRYKTKPVTSLWVLAGEWFGSIYIDYTAETEEHMDRLAEARYALQHAERVENILPAGVHHLSKDSIEILERVAEHGRKLAEKHLKRDGS